MLVTDYISKDFIPPKLNQTVGHGLALVNAYGLSHIPVFEGLSFAGSLSRETLSEHEPGILLSDLQDFSEFFYMTENGSLLDAVQNFHNYDTNVLTVLNAERQYLGMLMMDDVISGLSTMPFISEPGAIMVVEVSQKQFSISEIAKIAESNNARIIGLFLTGYQDDKIRITLKLISDNLTSVGETFERFNYTVLHKFFNDEKEDLMKDRFDLLMKYLDI